MRLFGLQPDQILARAHAAPLSAPAALSFAMTYGALSFGVVSVLGYSIWAFKLVREGPAMYAAIAVVYLGMGGPVLSRLVVGRGVVGRFGALFAAAFLLYVAGWCAGWFGLGGKYRGDLWGSMIGLAAMTWLLRRAFGKDDEFLPLFGVLFVFHTLGYFLGEGLMKAMRGSSQEAIGALLWGAAHGLGFGAGAGYVIFRCQEPLKLRLRSAVPR